MIHPVKSIYIRTRRRLSRHVVRPLRVAGKQKIFCIGRNKTGTTSMKAAMQELGFIVGNQRQAELLIDDWAQRDFRRIIRYCKSAQFFQDVPFSCSYTYVVLDHEFRGSKFILTVRDSAGQWYESLTRFHAKKWGKNGRIPTKEDLQEATYIEKGRPWHTNRLSAVAPEDDPYNKELLIAAYNTYNKTVQDYFRHRPDDLLVLNVAEPEAYKRLTAFLGIKTDKTEFPWENKT